MRKIDIFLLVSLLCASLVLARDAREQARIDYAIDSLGSLKGAVFIRNGTEYSAKAAQDHLRGKLKYAGDRVKTAEDFVKYCASESSMTHEPYRIRFADGTSVKTSDFFASKLKEFDQQKR
jgi:hypothetical protein